MKRSRLKFILVTCVIISSGASVFGQSAAPQTAEVKKLIAFYEWALEAKFKPEEQIRYQQLLEDEYRQQPESVRANVNTLLAAWSRITNSDEETRRRIHSEFLEAYLADLKQSSDARKVFLLNIYKEAHAVGAAAVDLDGTSMDKIDQPPPAGISTSELLIGKWERHTGSGSITDGTGKTKYGNGKTFTFEFGSGGRVEFISAEKTLSLMGCRSETTAKAPGRFTVNREKLFIELGTLDVVGTDSCDRKGNYKKSEPAGSITHTFQIRQSKSVFRPDKPTLLCFDGDEDTCFEKVPA